MRFSKSTIAAVAVSLPITLAQTFTDCDPTKKSCPNDVGLNQNAFTTNFMDGASASWTAAAYSTINYGGQGAEFSISKEKQAPTIETDFYIFFGRVDVKMKAAKGQGIVSSIVFESDDLDEIDWEFVGTDTTHVQSNFFGKGNTTAYNRVQYIEVSSPQDEFHTYSVDWNSDRIEWLIDGKSVRTLTYNDPLTVGGNNYPQTPMRIKLGNWCGGCKGMPNGTVDWAGGETTFDNAPYVMTVESVNIQNYNPAKEYQWTDRSGDWQSIKLIEDGGSSNPTGKASTTLSIAPTETIAPTQSHSVGHVSQTDVAVTTKSPPYGQGNSSATDGGQGTAVSTVIATTMVPGPNPTGAGGPLGGSGTPASSAAGSSQTGGSSSITQNAASLNNALFSTSLVGMLFSLLLL